MKGMKTDVKSVWNGEEVKVQGKKVVGKSAYEIGLIVEGQAKLLSPVDLGYLAASINTQSFDNGTELGVPVPNASKVRRTFQSNRVFTDRPDHFQKIQKPTQDTEVLVGTAVEYAPYVEFGTMKSSAQPFLRPALAMAMGKVLTVIRKMGKYYFKDYLNEFSNSRASYSKTGGWYFR